MRRFAAVVLSALLAAPAALAPAEEAPFEVSVTKEGAPDANVSVIFALATQGKVNLGTTDTQGQLSFALDAVNLGKRARIEVVVDDCPAEGQDAVYLLGPDGQLPAEGPDCKRRRAGFFWWGKARRIAVDVGRGTLVIQGGGLGKGTVIGVSAGLGLLGAVAIGKSGNDGPTATPVVMTPVPGGSTTTGTPATPPTTSTPAGSYNVITIVVVIDADGHHQFVNLTFRVLQIAGSGATLMVTGDGNWQPVQVNLAADGSFAGEGRGTFAGRTNVPFTVSGTLNTTTRRIVLRIVIGGGTLPGRGNDITYEVQLQG